MNSEHRVQALITFDIGTSSCKGALYSAADGSQIAERSASYPIQRPAPLWVEQSPEDWWRAVQTVCHDLLSVLPADQVVGVGLTGQVPTMVLVDKRGQAVAPAISWQDRRAEAEAIWLREEVGAQQLSDWLGLSMPVDAGWPPARLLWLSRHRRDLIDQTHKILMAKDYIGCQMTGEFFSDPWSSKGLIHLITREAPADYYRRLDLPASLAPRIYAPHEVIGEISKAAADQLGLNVGTPVVNGSSDAVCGMIETGAVGMGQAAFNLTGTSEMIGQAGGQPTDGLLYIPAVVTGGSPILYGPTQSGGDSLVWFAEFSNTPFEAVMTAAPDASPGADGVIFLPYLAGERAPIWDSNARGAFLGLLRSHTLASGARAVMEGVAMSARHVLETAGVAYGANLPLRIAGGSSRIAVWNQIRADVTGLEVEIVEQGGAVTLGAALLAALGVGLFPDLTTAGSLVRIQEKVAPRREYQTVYDEQYDRFRKAYQALRALW